jgi:hypothetical protein
MAKYFIYPLSGQTTAYGLTSGEIANTSGLPFTANTSVTNHTRLTDNGITSAASFQAQWDTVRFDKGGAAIDTITAIAFHCTAADASNGIRFSTSSSTSNSETDIRYTLSAVIKGWNVKNDITASGTDRYWYAVAHEGALSVVTEIIIGNQLDLTNIILGSTEGVSHGNDIIKTKGGNEFSIKQYGARRFWDLNLSHVTSAYKTTLESFKRSMDGSYYNFLYYDGSSYHYVYMDEASLSFKEIAFGVYRAKIKLIEVL